MRRVALPLAFCLLVGTLALPAAASPQPTPVCGPCGAGLTLAADEPDALGGLRVAESRAVVRVHDDGTATWRVRSTLANETALRYLRDHPEAVDRLVRDALRYGTVEGPFENVSARLDGETLHATYEDADAGRRTPGGVLLVEYFHSRGYDRWPVLTADRLTVVGPPGTAVTNDPPGARVEGRNATWTGNASASVYDAPRVETDAYVAYAADGPLAGVWTALGIALATAPIVIDVTASMLVPPLVVLGLGLAGMVLLARRLCSRPGVDLRRSATAVAGLGAVVFLLGLPWPSTISIVGTYRILGAAGGVALAMGAVARWRGRATRARDLVAVGCLVLAGFAATLALTLPDQYVSQARAVRVGVREALRLLPVVTLPVLGAAVGSRRREALAGAGVLAAFLASELVVVWPTQRPFGLVVVFFFAYAVGVAVGGLPLVVLGACLDREA